MERLKKDLVNKLFFGDDINKIAEDKSSNLQNIKYRYSTPWTTLLSAAKVLGNDCQITQNLSLRTNFEVNNIQGQFVFDAAITKALKYLANEMELDEEELLGTITDKIIKKKLVGEPVYKAVEFLKKLRPDMIDNT